MKQTPDWSEAQERMRPGRLTRDGMLGDDTRSLAEIIDGDAAALARRGVTCPDLAERLRRISGMARNALGTPVEVAPDFEAWMDEGMGRIPCPFGHPGRVPKAVTYLRRRSTGRLIQWSDLNIHMIEEHGFFEGTGAAFRLEPEEAAEMLGLTTPPPLSQTPPRTCGSAPRPHPSA